MFEGTILTGIGLVLADDCRLNDPSGEERGRPLLRIVVDSTLRLPSESRMAASCASDVLAWKCWKARTGEPVRAPKTLGGMQSLQGDGAGRTRFVFAMCGCTRSRRMSSR